MLPGPQGSSACASSSARSGRQVRNSTPYSYAVAGDAAEIDRDLSAFTTMLIAALAVLGLGLVAATFFQVRFGLSPLRAIRQDLAAIRSGEAEKLEGELPDEIRPLQQELNALIQSNREIVERARTHVGNLAHALKTPLSVITNEAREHEGALAAKVVEQAEIMRDPDHPPSRPGAGGGAVERHRRRHRGRGRASGAEADARPHLRGARARRSRSTCADGLKFQGEKQDFEEMVGNLLDNACKWASVAGQRGSASRTRRRGAAHRGGR